MTQSSSLLVHVIGGSGAMRTLRKLDPDLPVWIAMRDRDVHAGLSAHGVAIALEHLLCLAGGPAVAAGLYNPENLLDPARVVSRLRELGAEVERF